MNILPKKSWHVRTKQNVARVRRDEAKAAEEEKERQRRAALAEQEARTAHLRREASKRLGVPESSKPEDDKTVVVFKEGEHVNLFQAVEDGQKSWGVNKDYEKEKKEEQEKYEKSIGYLTYLGQTALDNKGEEPWYQKSHQDRLHGGKDDDKEAAVKTKSFLDPLKDVRKYLDSFEKKPQPNSDRKPITQATSQKATVHSYQAVVLKQSKKKQKKSSKRRNKDSKKKSKKRKRRRSDSSSSSSDSDDESSEERRDTAEVRNKSKMVEYLRLQRLQREKEERARAEKLLAKLRGEDAEKVEKGPSTSTESQQYNSQYNPHLAKRPRLTS